MEPLTALSPAARSLLARARRGEASSESDRERVWASVSTGVAAASVGAGTNALVTATKAGWRGSFAKAIPMSHALAAFAVVFAAGVATGRMTSKHEPAPREHVGGQLTVTVAPLPPPIASAVAPPMLAVSSLPEAPTQTPASSKGATASTNAAQQSAALDEARSILRAKRALDDGHPTAALVELEAHERVYPHGTLSEERDALRVLALCAVGRKVEGVEERARFLRTQPLSVYAARVQAACQP